MCGIGGYFLKPNDKIPRGFMDNLEEGLRHRGPDGSRRASYGSAGFVHTRLAIIDVAGGATCMAGIILRALVSDSREGSRPDQPIDAILAQT